MFRLIRELRQRRVFRVSGYYLFVAWVMLQVGDIVVDAAGMPSWSMTLLLYLLVLGFPVATVLGWRYDITENGIVRTRINPDEELDPEPLRAVDYLLITGLLAISGAAIYQLLPIAQQSESPRVADEVRDARRPNSIAVLPFTDLSQDQRHQFLGDGISDTVMHVLSQIGELSVTARTSSFAFKGEGKSVVEIATALAVAHVLEGSVQRAGEKVRVIARLVDARSGSEVWSGYYERSMDSIFAIQDEIAHEVATALMTEVLDTGDAVMLADEYEPSLEAYEKFILGKQQLSLRTLPGAQAAEVLFREAVELDPGYALAHVYLGQAVLSVADLDRRRVSVESANAHVETALDLNPQLPEAHGLRARLLVILKRFDEAELAIKRALELAPSYAEAHAIYSNLYTVQGDVERSLMEIRKAIELDPQENRYQTELAHSLWSVSRAEEAIMTIREAIERNPKVPANYGTLGRWHMQLGQVGKGAYWLEQAERLNGVAGQTLLTHCMNLVHLWAFDRATDCFQAFLRSEPDHTEAIQWLAILNNDQARAISKLREAVTGNPDFWYRRFQLSDWLIEAGRMQEAIDVLRPVTSKLFQEQPEISDITIWGAINLAQAYRALGEEERAAALIEAGLAHVERRRKLQASGFMAGIEDAKLLLVAGRHDEALARLERAVGSGWRFYSSELTRWFWDPVRDDPRFQAVMDTLRRDFAAQLEWYDDNRNVPVDAVPL